MDIPGLKVYTVISEYLLVMKVVAGRPADVSDIQALAQHLNLTRAQDILRIVVQYIPASQLTPQMQYLIQSMFP